MSRTDTHDEAVGVASSEPIVRFEPRETSLGNLEIRRLLPTRERRLIGPWCFLDRYGPLSFTDEKPMDVAPHPHIGLQTVSWLYDGEILHRDSLGNENVVRPGELNVMTSGDAIAHSEETPRENRGVLSGAQLWVALPAAERKREGDFQHVGSLPVIDLEHGEMSLLVGSYEGTVSPATMYSPIFGGELRLRPGETGVATRPGWEYGVIVDSGEVLLEGIRLEHDTLYYLSPGRGGIALAARDRARALLLGGAPFPEKIVMWWNFVARSFDEIVEARSAWAAGERFGAVPGYEGSRVEAPPIREQTPPPQPAS